LAIAASRAAGGLRQSRLRLGGRRFILAIAASRAAGGLRQSRLRLGGRRFFIQPERLHSRSHPAHVFDLS